MVQEFLEVDDMETFRLVAEQSPLIIRLDPYLFAQYFAGMFYINLAKLEREDVRKLFEMLRGKMVLVKRVIKATSISEFMEKSEG